jgi:2'-5' RNA ligase
MDLLSLIDCSSDSDKDSIQGDKKGTKSNSESLKTGRRLDDDAVKAPGGERITHSPNKKRKRGSVSTVPSSQAPASTFLRSIPHRRGHWSGHIMVPVTCFSRGGIQQSISKFQKRLEDHGYSGLVVEHDERHISLSKHFSLQAGNLESFCDKLAERLSKEHATHLYVDPTGHTLVNEEGTRSFWGWNVQPNAVLRRIVSHVENVLQQYNQPSYYENPIFHISFASFPGKVDFQQDDNDSSFSQEESEKSSNSDDEDVDEEVDHILVDQIHCKFGGKNCKNFVIKLRPK